MLIPACHRKTRGFQTSPAAARVQNTKKTFVPDRCSAALWEFNPTLSVWTEVVVGASEAAPAARDGHTASVAGTKMIIFGGRGNGPDSDSQGGQGLRTALLDDEWEIDLDPYRHVTVATDSATVSASMYLSLPLAGGSVNSKGGGKLFGCSRGPDCDRFLPNRLAPTERVRLSYDQKLFMAERF